MTHTVKTLAAELTTAQAQILKLAAALEASTLTNAAALQMLADLVEAGFKHTEGRLDKAVGAFKDLRDSARPIVAKREPSAPSTYIPRDEFARALEAMREEDEHGRQNWPVSMIKARAALMRLDD